jgi:hypothetical protein
MSVRPEDERIDAYLWDPAAQAADEVLAIESMLAPLRFEPATRRLAIVTPAPEAKPRRLRRWWYPTAAAALVLVITGVLFGQWRWQWPDGQPWTIAARPAAAPDRLAVGVPLLLSGPEVARIDIARIGTLTVKGDSRLTLRSTSGSRHRLSLDRGSVHVSVWAPPGSVHVQTPAGDVIDLGCAFDLTVDDAGEISVIVQSGWVQLANNVGETLVPAGADSGMRASRRPGAPVFLDASPVFRAAVRSAEADAITTDSADIDAIVANARVRDVLTLLVLVQRRSAGSDRLAARAAELSPPPLDVTVSAVVRGDALALERWRETLPLPPPKSWLRNWVDGAPAWLRPAPR